MEFANLRIALEGKITELEDLGWDVSITDDSVELRGHLSNRELQKAPIILLYRQEPLEPIGGFHQEEETQLPHNSSIQFLAGSFQTELHLVPKQDRGRPWRVEGPRWRFTFKHVELAIDAFLDLARQHAPKRKP